MIDDEGNNLGTIPTYKALAIAKEKELDLIEVNPKARPSICKIMDFGQHKYKQDRADAKQRARQKKIETKGIRISFKMGEHDLNVRKKQAEKFLKEGHKVKIELILRGRENAHKDLAGQKVTDFTTLLDEDVETEQELAKKGNRLSIIIYKKK